MKFTDIEFKPRFPEADCEAVKDISPDTYEWMSTSKQARVSFPNGYEVSILLGSMFYSNGIDTYELAVFHDGSITYDTPITSDVLGYLTEPGLMENLQQIENLPTKENT